ncbi:transcription termination factor MTEF1, chloroplastic [Olea europaea subsp. europaea]|uniref:Transcription termination factor MTEF1, chloroplastic n=1 Tax=Olea europaea subsp. europaea TaxID=158383 RepID=A0A8S0Q4N1_OLEEU|nr:transcription termination factor MTEF1, chloroplastic [Olea europaea subsp. europaea]
MPGVICENQIKGKRMWPLIKKAPLFPTISSLQRRSSHVDCSATIYSSPCFSAQKSPYGVSDSRIESNLLTTNTKTLLEKLSLYTPTHSKISLQFKEKIPRLEIMGIDSGRALSENPFLHTASLHSINEIITFL